MLPRPNRTIRPAVRPRRRRVHHVTAAWVGAACLLLGWSGPLDAGGAAAGHPVVLVSAPGHGPTPLEGRPVAARRRDVGVRAHLRRRSPAPAHRHRTRRSGTSGGRPTTGTAPTTTASTGTAAAPVTGVPTGSVPATTVPTGSVPATTVPAGGSTTTRVGPAAGTGPGQPATAAVHVSGNTLVDAAGRPVRLLGVDRSGTEYACAEGWGIFDGPSDAASVAAIAAWHVDAVRVPLNEDCWLAVNGVPAAYSGAAYRDAIESYVAELNAAGITAVLDLHWGAPGTEVALGQEQMPDADHSVPFWHSVASTFADTPGVVFDLFNEPHDVAWSCWRNGCTLADGTVAAGMQTLVDTVRATGATQPVMVEGLDWGADLSGWAQWAPVDPDHQLVASVHIYDTSGCNTEACWSSTIAPVAATVPVVSGEIGESDCADGFIDRYMAWADTAGVSYLAWTWDAGGGWSCSGGPALLDSYDGVPNAFGAGFETHLAALAAAGGDPTGPAGGA